MRPPLPLRVSLILGPVLLVMLTACNDSAAVSETSSAIQSSVGSSAPPAVGVGTAGPAFCGSLEADSPLATFPSALVTLVTNPTDETAKQAIIVAGDTANQLASNPELTSGYPELAAAASSLATQIAALGEQPTNAEALAAVGADLDKLGELVQPVCQLATS